MYDLSHLKALMSLYLGLDMRFSCTSATVVDTSLYLAEGRYSNRRGEEEEEEEEEEQTKLFKLFSLSTSITAILATYSDLSSDLTASDLVYTLLYDQEISTVFKDRL